MGKMKDQWIADLNGLSNREIQESFLKTEPMVLAAIEKEKAKGNIRASYTYRITASGVEILGPPEWLRIRWPEAPAPDALRTPERVLRLFLSAKRCDVLLGDLQEQFHHEVQVRGRRGAMLWCWIEVLCALCALVPANIHRTVRFWLKFGR